MQTPINPPISAPQESNITSVTTRRRFLQTSLLGAAGLASLPLISRAQRPAVGRKNLLFFFTDQQSWDMLGCNGNEGVLTPRIDEFAKTAVSFNHCVSNCPVCTPARGMILTGQHPLHNGAFTNDAQLLTGDTTSIAEVLSENGYDTCYIGKWHLYGGKRPRPIPPGPHRHGFDTFLSNNCTLDFRPEAAFYYDDEGNEQMLNEWEAYGQTRQAIEFIENQPADRPFALFVSLHPPHDQGFHRGALRYQSIPELMNRVDRSKITMRGNVKPRLTPPGRPADERSHEQFLSELLDDYHGYYAMVAGCDDCFGGVTDALARKGFEDNTVVTYTSDHGDLLASHGRPWTKSVPEDEAVRVPLLIRCPGLTAPGTRTDLLFGTLDFMPTLLSMLDLPNPSGLHGKDLSTAIANQDDDAVSEQPLFYFWPGWRGIYTKRYTYAWDEFDGSNWLDHRVLYDREVDPLQENNLFHSTDPEVVALKADLHERSLRLLRKFDDPFIGGENTMRMLGKEPTTMDREGETGYFGGRPIDLLNAHPDKAKYQLVSHDS